MYIFIVAVKDYGGLYQVSNYSRIRSFNKGRAKILKPYFTDLGYLTVRLYKDGHSRGYKLHRLVAEAFVPNPDNKPEVHHVNGDKLNCCPVNLVWCTKSEHKQHDRKFSRESIGVEAPLPVVLTVENVRCYLDENGTIWLNAEDVARGLGFTQTKNGIEYVRWETVNNYLSDFGFSQQVGKEDFLPENMFYRLAMKAKNETAEKFQAKVADEILPTIRKTGKYEVKAVPEKKVIEEFSAREKIKLLKELIDITENQDLRDKIVEKIIEIV